MTTLEPARVVVPTAEAVRLRREADTAELSRRAYLLWLADEWEKSAARDGDAVRRRSRPSASTR